MTDSEVDNFVRKALLFSNSPEVMRLSKTPQDVSELFQRKIKIIIKNPEKVGKQSLWPAWRKITHYVACAILAVTLTFGCVLAVSPAAREWVKNVVIEWLQEYVDFKFYGEDSGLTNGYWRPQVIPEGYIEVEVDEEDGYGTVVYENVDGVALYFDSRKKGEGRQYNIDTAHSDINEIEINGHPAYEFQSNSKGWPNYLIWLSNDEETVFLLTGEVSCSELEKIARSVANILEP